MRGRILIFDRQIPKPDKDSGSRSTFSYLQILSQAGFEIIFVPANLRRARTRYNEALIALGINIATIPKWTKIEDVARSFAPLSDLVLLYRAPIAARLFDLIRLVAPHTSILFHPVDLHFLRVEREAELNKNLETKNAANSMRRIELDLINRADASIVVSAYEKKLLRELAPLAVVHRIPILREIPRRSQRASLYWRARHLCQHLGKCGRWVNTIDPAFRRRSKLVFLGGFAHTANVDAINWFIGKVWPLLQKRGFPYRLTIAGAEMPDQIAALASDRIEVMGHVKNLRRLFAECRLSIAPLRYGAGMKGKIVESLSYGVPVVATSVAAEGMDLHHNETLLIANSPPTMADEIVRLSEDDDLWQMLSQGGYRYFEKHFSIGVGARVLVPLVESLVEKSRESRRRHNY